MLRVTSIFFLLYCECSLEPNSRGEWVSKETGVGGVRGWGGWGGVKAVVQDGANGGLGGISEWVILWLGFLTNCLDSILLRNIIGNFVLESKRCEKQLQNKLVAPFPLIFWVIIAFYLLMCWFKKKNFYNSCFAARSNWLYEKPDPLKHT